LGAAVVAGIAGGIGSPLWNSDSKLCGGGLLVVAFLAWFGGVISAKTEWDKKTVVILISGVAAIIAQAVVAAFTG
jgi:hypothetical protein